jgi:hypothetical protein
MINDSILSLFKLYLTIASSVKKKHQHMLKYKRKTLKIYIFEDGHSI